MADKSAVDHLGDGLGGGSGGEAGMDRRGGMIQWEEVINKSQN